LDHDPATTNGSLRICLAEDHTDARMVVKAMLTKLGHRVVADVPNGEELLRAADEHELDLIILDLDMPVMDGLAAADEIHRRKPVPIILLSGHPDAQHIVVENEPITTCLLKPVTMDKLRQGILQALGQADGSADCAQ
jgi:two-component system, response regulator PdtaR